MVVKKLNVVGEVNLNPNQGENDLERVGVGKERVEVGKKRVEERGGEISLGWNLKIIQFLLKYLNIILM